MVEYTIAAIPTEYRGVLYRSRLEARWAAFFDLLGWKANYEPFDLGAWSPDFAIDYKMVEVKPIEVFDEITAAKMAAATSNLFRSTRAGGLWLTRLAPVFPPENECWPIKVGWTCSFSTGEWHEAQLLWGINSGSVPGVEPFVFRMTPDFVGGFSAYPDYTRELWAGACNAVQWKGPQS